jgi:uncharacterized protein YggE
MKRNLALILFVWSIPGIAAAQWNAASDPFPTISTSATAEVKVAPDQVYLSLGVTVRNKDLEAAKQESDQRVAAVLKSLQENGVADKDMQTDYVNIQPLYENVVAATPDVYVVARSIGVRVRDIDSFEKVLTDALNSGANQVGGIDFRTSDLQKHRDEARKLAIRAAREKAETLAAQLGAKLGAVHSISENVNNSCLGALNGCFASNAILNISDSSATSDTLATGQINVTATVNLKFRLE